MNFGCFFFGGKTMFIAWGSKWKYKVKKNGLCVNKMCPECDQNGDFFEVIPTKYFTLFWIPLASTETKKALLECPYCHERFYIQSSDYYAANKQANVIVMPPPIKKKMIPPKKEISFIFKCEECSQKLRVPQKKETIAVHCPKCNNSFRVKNGKII